MHTIHVKAHTGSKEELVKKLKGYNSAFTYLKEILPQLEKKPAVRDYEVPQWELRQVAVNEYNQAIADLLKLLETKE